MADDLHEIAVELDLKVLKISGKWDPRETEKIAAWELYVELVTRISVVPLSSDEGSLREAMDSLYKLFSIVREILKSHKTDIAKPRKKKSEITIAYLCIAVLNRHLRPFLTRWHPRLRDHEITRKSTEAQLDHEWKWSRHKECRDELISIQKGLTDFASVLAQAAGFPHVYDQVIAESN